MKAEIKKLKKKGSDGVTEERMAKFTKETVKGTQFENRQFVWTDDETELMLKQQPGFSEYVDIWSTVLYNECG